MHKVVSFRVVIALILSLLIFFVIWQKRTLKEYKSQQFLMDTLVTITVYGKDIQLLQSSVNEAFAEMRKIAELSDHFPPKNSPAYKSSDICKINENAGIKAVLVHPDIMNILSIAKEYALKSGGSFDPTIGEVVDLWGFGTEHPSVPDTEKLNQALQKSGYDHLHLDPKKRTAFLNKSGVSIDLGACAKGYAAEKAGRLLAQSGVEKAIIDAGGNIRTVGKNIHNRPWQIGIKDPRNEGGIVATVSLENASLVTSGDYYRNFEVNGRRYHHILDPHTGYPPNHTISATVMTPDSTLADILSTACFVLPPDEALAFASKIPNVALLLITAEKRIIHTANLKGKISIMPKSGYLYNNGQ